MDKLSLLSWLDEASANDIPFGRYCLQTQASEMEIDEDVLLQRMQEFLAAMREAIDYGLTGVRSTSGLAGGNGLLFQNWHSTEKTGNKILGPLAAKAVAYALAANESMAAVGRSLPNSLRETGQGGLAATPTGLECAERIFGARNHLKE